MVAALETKELALPAFLLGGAAIPLVASLGRITGILFRTWVAAAIGIGGMRASRSRHRGSSERARPRALAAGRHLAQVLKSRH